VRAQRARDVVGLVVDRAVEPELLDDPAALPCAAGDPDRTRALDPGDLAGDAANRPGSARDHHRFPVTRAADFQQPEVCRQAGQAERAEIGRQRRERRVNRDHPMAVGHRELLHSERPVHVIALCERRVLGSDHATDCAGTHDRADLDRLDVRGACVHPTAHRRVEREV